MALAPHAEGARRVHLQALALLLLHRSSVRLLHGERAMAVAPVVVTIPRDARSLRR
jgi:hypothetical protein